MDRTSEAQGAAADTGVLDAAAVERLRELDPQGRQSLVPRVLRAYESSLVRQLEEIGEARRSGQWDRVSRIAHTLKSSSASIGALALSRRCAEIERTLREGAAPAEWPELDALAVEARQVLAAVRAMLPA